MEFWTAKQDKTKWHVWYAWYPVCIEQDDDKKVWIWRENVLRCKTYSYADYDSGGTWHYKSIKGSSNERGSEKDCTG